MTAGKMSRRRRALLIVLTLAILALAALWFQRKPIARNYVDAELQKRGVRGSYEIADLGVRRQRIEKLVLGDPAQPDLTADWVELRMNYGFGTPRLADVRAGGVRLRGRLVDGVLSLGELDKLMPAPSGKPFTLPDLRVELADARMRLDSDFGQIGLKLDGGGHLRDGFRGKLAAVAPGLAFGDCRVAGATAWVDLKIIDRSPAVSGPVRADGVTCSGGDAGAGKTDLAVDAALSEAFDAWKGEARLQLADAHYADSRLVGLTGRLDFDGGIKGTKGSARLAARGFATAQAIGTGLRLAGDYGLGRGAIRFDGTAGAGNARLAPAGLAMIRSFAGTGAGTPVGPLASALSNALAKAGESAAIDAAFGIDQRDGAGTLTLTRLSTRSASGAVGALGQGKGVNLTWPGGAALIDGTLTLSGGGLPEGSIRLVQATAGGPVSGEARFAPYAAGGSQLTMAPVRFTTRSDGAAFETRLTLDGPLGDGRVVGLTLPVAGLFDTRGNLIVNRGCAPLEWRSVSVAGLALAPARVGLCPVEGGALLVRSGGRTLGGASIVAPRLTGRLGSSPITLAASGARLTLGDGTLGLSDVAVRLGAPDSLSRLNIGRLDGRIARGGIAGRFAALDGKIGAVPLLISEGEGDWRLLNGALTLGGALRVADEANPPRFQPLLSRDFTLALVNGRIDANGTLVDPKHGVTIAQVDIVHRLGAGTGEAALTVPGIRFGEGLQPEELTALTLGVVANVRGTVTGRGDIRWTPRGVTSDGSFRTDDTALAAAFGPVEGLSGEIRFTDLLALETAPGQILKLRQINPGIPVGDGEVRYQLLAGQRVRIEGGRWPFAGGELILDPTILDLAATERRLTFRVVGLEAASFINTFEFDNLNATGKFDGVLPMIFDAEGGRIEGGFLKVREEGGTLAYIGEVTNAHLGFFARIAFDALKSIKYKRLTIGINGAIDGELVSDIRFDGVNQEGIAKGKGGLFEQILGRQFIFNIKITAPFRGLMTTAKSFYDPSILVRDALPPSVKPVDNAAPEAKLVQPHESEPVP